MKSWNLLLILAAMSLIWACKSKPVTPPPTSPDPPVVEQPKEPTGKTTAQVIEELHQNYNPGEIQQCLFQGAVIYKCSKNAPDAGSEIFDAKGTKLGGCYYNTRIFHPACEEATNCKVIFRSERNIWGKPGVILVLPD